MILKNIFLSRRLRVSLLEVCMHLSSSSYANSQVCLTTVDSSLSITVTLSLWWCNRSGRRNSNLLSAHSTWDLWCTVAALEQTPVRILRFALVPIILWVLHIYSYVIRENDSLLIRSCTCTKAWFRDGFNTLLNSLLLCQGCWFQQDGTSVHMHLQTMEVVAPIPLWRPSPDLSTVDFFPMGLHEGHSVLDMSYRHRWFKTGISPLYVSHP